MTAFDPQPTLANHRVALRPLRPDDFDSLYAVAADPLLWQLHPAHDRWQEPVFRTLFAQSIASGGALIISDAATGEVIGSSRYDHTRAESADEVEIGWTFLARSYWGGSTNRAIKQLMVEHALQSLDRTIFVVGEHNIRSRRAMEKIGGQLTSRTLTAQMAGAPVQHVVYAISRDTYPGSPLTLPLP